MRHKSILAFAICAFICNCSSKGPEEELTIVVREDTERISEAKSKLEQERLEIVERKKDLDDIERNIRKLSESGNATGSEDLQRAFEQLRKLQANLKRSQDTRAQELDTRSAELEHLRQTLAAKSSTSGQVNAQQDSVAVKALLGELKRSQTDLQKEMSSIKNGLASLEAQLRALTESVQKMPTPSGVIIPAATTESGKKVKRSTAERAYKQVNLQMLKKGLLINDLPPNVQPHNAAAKRAMAAGDYALVYDLSNQLQDAIKAVQIDGNFVDLKIRRLQQTRRQSPPPALVKAEFEKGFETTTKLFTDGKFERANSELNHLFSLLSK